MRIVARQRQQIAAHRDFGDVELLEFEGAVERLLGRIRHRGDVAALDRRAAVEDRGGAVVVADGQAQFQRHTQSPRSAGASLRHAAVPYRNCMALRVDGPRRVAIVACHHCKDANSQTNVEGRSTPHETSALRIRLPGHHQRSRRAARQPQRRGQAAGRRPEPDADDGVSHRTAVAAGGFAEIAGPEGDQDRRRTASGSARWCAGATSSTTSGSPPRIRCCRRRSRTSRITRSATAAPSAAACAHADPASEMPGIAQTCDAEISVIGKAGARTIKAADFFQGALTTALEPDEIITEMHLPAWPAARRYGFQEFARRRGDFAMAGVALYYDIDGGKAANAHIGVFGVGDCQRRLPKAEGRAERPCGRRGARRQGRRGRRRRGRAAGGHPRQRRLPPRAHRHAHRARAQGRGGEVEQHDHEIRSQRQAGQRRCRAAADARRLPAPRACASPAPTSAASTASAAPAPCWWTARRCAPA